MVHLIYDTVTNYSDALMMSQTHCWPAVLTAGENKSFVPFPTPTF
jgi:hypothetical protein